MNLSRRIGFVLSTLHAVLVSYIVCCILFANEPVWPMYWLIFLLLDFPVSLLYVGSNFLPFPVIMKNIPGLPPPFDSIYNFWMPLIVFGIFGTLWYFYLPILIAKLFRRDKRPIDIIITFLLVGAVVFILFRLMMVTIVALKSHG